MPKDEALREAIDTLKQTKHGNCDYAWIDGTIEKCTAALAQPEQEPVAFYHPRNGFYWAKPTSIFAPTAVDVKPLPLYTALPQQEKNNG